MPEAKDKTDSGTIFDAPWDEEDGNESGEAGVPSGDSREEDLDDIGGDTGARESDDEDEVGDGTASDADEDSEEVGDDGSAAGDDEEGEGDEGEQTVTLKIDGEEIEKPISEVVKIAQKNIAADKRLQEASVKLKELAKKEEELEALEGDIVYFRDSVLRDPIKVVRDMLLASGQYDEEQVFNALYSYTQNTFKQLVEEAKNPDKRKANWTKEQLEKIRQENESLRKSQQEKQEQAEIERLHEEIMSETRSALEKASLPTDEETMAEVVEILIAADDAGEDLTPTQAVSILKDRIVEKRKQLLSGLTYDDLKKYPELLSKIRTEDLEELEKRSKAGGAKRGTKRTPSATKPKRRAKSGKRLSDIFDPFEHLD